MARSLQGPVGSDMGLSQLLLAPSLASGLHMALLSHFLSGSRAELLIPWAAYSEPEKLK